MFTRIRVAVALAAAAFGLLASAAPTHAAEPAKPAQRPAVHLSAKQAAAMFKVVPVSASTRQAAAAEIGCGQLAPLYTIFYIPTNTNLFQQATVINPCIDGRVVTRLEKPTTVRVDILAGGLIFGPARVQEFPPFTGPISSYIVNGSQPFTYCVPDLSGCVSATFNVQVLFSGNSFSDNVGFFS